MKTESAQYGLYIIFKKDLTVALERDRFIAEFRESSFNMTKGGGMKILRGVLRKFLDIRKGGSEKIRGGSENLYTSKPTGGGAPKKLNH